MARVKRAVHGKKHRRVVLDRAKGYYGNKSRSYRAANEQVMHSLQYAYRDRRARKGDFRKLWIQRINAAARLEGISYSRLVAGLHRAGVSVDRKILADIAVRDRASFAALVAVATEALGEDGSKQSSAFGDLEAEGLEAEEAEDLVEPVPGPEAVDGGPVDGGPVEVAS